MKVTDTPACRKQETTHIVAFLDLLNASNIIRGALSEQYLKVISEIFDKAGSDWPFLPNVPHTLAKIKRVTFSDNIALALELPEEPVHSTPVETIVEDFIKYISVIQGTALKNRLLFRGGIAVGSLYISSDENLVWGKALVDATELEKHASTYPRVVLSRQLDKYNPSNMSRVCRDFDGMLFVDYLSAVKTKYPDWIEGIKALIQDEYAKIIQKEAQGEWGQERILQKYEWLRYYIEQGK